MANNEIRRDGPFHPRANTLEGTAVIDPFFFPTRFNQRPPSRATLFLPSGLTSRQTARARPDPAQSKHNFALSPPVLSISIPPNLSKHSCASPTMDAPEPEQTPFASVTAHTSRITRVCPAPPLHWLEALELTSCSNIKPCWTSQHPL